MKKVLVIRYGAFGDAIMVTPLLRLLKEDGFHITLNCSEYSRQIYNNNPFVDEFKIHVTDSVPNEKLGEYWEELGKGFDKVVNLSGSIEAGLLKAEGSPEFNWSHERRHAECNVNYYDRTLEIGGYGHIKGRNGELYFTEEEEKWARDNTFKGKFNILWSLSGSSMHKVYHRAEYAALRLLNKYRDVRTTTVGDDICHLLEWEHKQARMASGKWSIRQSLVMVKHSDLVVGTETGILNAAGCYDVPKVLLLSHSSEENLSKNWKNCVSLHSNPPCHPCHQIHYTLNSCPLKVVIEPDLAIPGSLITAKYPVCMADLKEDDLFEAIEKVYLNWKEKTWQPLQPQLVQQ